MRHMQIEFQDTKAVFPGATYSEKDETIIVNNAIKFAYDKDEKFTPYVTVITVPGQLEPIVTKAGSFAEAVKWAVFYTNAYNIHF
jgi:hypothetical protein